MPPSLPPRPAAAAAPRRLPPLETLGRDLLVVTPAERVLSLVRPFVCLALYVGCALLGWWVPAVCAVAALMMITYISTSHDLVHRTLGLPARANDWALAVIEALVLRSGHAFRLTHLHHHQRFPHDDDLEGRAAHGSWWQALLAGPTYQPRLWWWAWRHTAGKPVERRWLAAEAAWTGLFLGGSLLLWAGHVTVVPAVYAGLVLTSSWLYPFATAYVPHVVDPRGPLFQTRLFRGRLVPWLFLQHTYHLEHHLYPMVSSHRWQELGRRLDAHFQAAGIEAIRLP